jgi:hypothetical protein
MTEQQLAQLTAALVEMRGEIKRLSISVGLLKMLLAMQVFANPQEQQMLAAILRALKNWSPGRA